MILATQMKLFAQSARHDANAPWLGRWPVDTASSAHPAISVATTDDELRDIGRLRYDLYIDRDGKKYRHVDYAARTFIEPIDRVSLNFQALVDGELLAAVRLVRAEDALLDPHLRLLVEAYHPASLETTVVCSRFAVKPENRARAMIKPMFQDAFRASVDSGARHFILGARSGLIELFQRFGFSTVGKTVWDPVAPQMQLLHLSLDNPFHVERKPFRLIAEAQLALSGMSNSEARVPA